ncbi:calcium,calmodulin-dependent protein kinase [Sarracenia purpurea var. burkii]
MRSFVRQSTKGKWPQSPLYFNHHTNSCVLLRLIQSREAHKIAETNREINRSMCEGLNSEYRLCEEIGRGRFRVVYRCFSAVSGDAFACKSID